MHEFIAVKHSLVNPPKLKIIGINSFSLIFREQNDEEKETSISLPVSVIMGFDDLNLVYLSMELLKMPTSKIDEFYSLLYTMTKNGVEANLPYIYIYFKDYEGVLDYYDFLAEVTFFVDKLGIKRIDFVVDKNYEELEYLMRRIASVP